MLIDLSSGLCFITLKITLIGIIYVGVPTALLPIILFPDVLGAGAPLILSIAYPLSPPIPPDAPLEGLPLGAFVALALGFAVSPPCPPAPAEDPPVPPSPPSVASPSSPSSPFEP